VPTCTLPDPSRTADCWVVGWMDRGVGGGRGGRRKRRGPNGRKHFLLSAFPCLSFRTQCLEEKRGGRQGRREYERKERFRELSNERRNDGPKEKLSRANECVGDSLLLSCCHFCIFTFGLCLFRPSFLLTFFGVSLLLGSSSTNSETNLTFVSLRSVLN